MVTPGLSSGLDHARRNRSPFFARTYGGFTSEQEAFYRAHIGDPLKKVILDPMGGQGYMLSSLARNGAEVWLGDIDPAPLHLAMLRDPRMIIRCEELVAWFKEWFVPFRRSKKANQSKYSDDWIIPPIKDELRAFSIELGMKPTASPFSYSKSFWTAPIHIRFAACMPILAARSLSCFRESDNKTWLKKGGLARETSIYHPVMRALDLWYRYAIETMQAYRGRLGTISVRRMNAEQGLIAEPRLADTIVTSPPYANRLDYTRMWAPELEVLSAMWRGDSDEIKANQIGSTVVEGKEFPSDSEAILPRSIRKALREIRNDSNWKASDSYYYPFFRNYALSLAESLPNIASHLGPGGTFVIFVRDTVRKDIMFPTQDLIRSILVNKERMRLVSREKHILRSHVGFLRKASAGGMYGLAQLEWWLAFQKENI